MKKTWKSLTALALSAAMVFSNSAVVAYAEEGEPEKKVSGIEEPGKVEAGIPEKEPEKVEVETPEKVEAETPEKVETETPEKVETETPEKEKPSSAAALKTQEIPEQGEEPEKSRESADVAVKSNEFSYNIYYGGVYDTEMLLNDKVTLDQFVVTDENYCQIDDYELEISDVAGPQGASAVVSEEDQKRIDVTSGGEEGKITFNVVAKIGEGEQTESYPITIKVSKVRYALKASPIKNINIRETLDLSTIKWDLTKTYKQDGSQKVEPVDMKKEGIQLELTNTPSEYDAWEIEQKGNLPVIRRIKNEYIYLAFKAVSEGGVTLAETYVSLNQIDYGIGIRSSYGIVYSDSDMYIDEPLTFTAYQQNGGMTLPDGCDYMWEVDVPEPIKDAVQWKRDETNKTKMTITVGDPEKIGENTENNITVRVIVKKGDTELCSLQVVELNLKNPEFKPGEDEDGDVFEGTQYVGTEYQVPAFFLGNWYDGKHPKGKSVVADVVRVESSDPEAVEVKDEKTLIAKAPGSAVVTYTVKLPETLKEEEITFASNVEVVEKGSGEESDEDYHLSFSTPTYAEMFLDDSATWTPKVRKGDKPVEDYTLKIENKELSPRNIDANVKVDGKSIIVTSGKKEGSITFKVRAEIDGENTEERSITAVIQENYYKLEAPEVENIDIGEKLDLNTVGWSLTKTNKDGKDQKVTDMNKEGIKLKFDENGYYDEESWEITPQGEGRLPVLKRISAGWLYLYINAVSTKTGKTVASAYIEIDSQYPFGLEYSYGEGEEWYTDTPLTITARRSEDVKLPAGDLTYKWEIDESRLPDGVEVSYDKESLNKESLTITGKIEEKGDEEVYEVPVTLTIQKDGKRLQTLSNWLSLRNPYINFGYGFFDDTEYVEKEYDVPSVKEVWYYSGRCPKGDARQVKIKDVRSSNPDVKVTPAPNGDGWKIKTEKPGKAVIVYTLDTSEVVDRISERVRFDTGRSDLWLDLGGNDHVYPGKTFNVSAKGDYYKYENGQVVNKTEELTYKWTVEAYIAEDSEDDTEIELEEVVENLEDINIESSNSLQIKVKSDAPDCEIDISFSAYDQEGNYIGRDYGWAYVKKDLYEISSEKVDVHPGDSVDLRGKVALKHYTAATPNGTKVNATITYGDVHGYGVSWVDKKNGIVKIAGDAMNRYDEKDLPRVYVKAKAASGGDSDWIDIRIHEPKWSAWKISSPASVSAPEQQIRTCSVCGKSETRTGSKLTPYLTLSANSLKMKVKQKTTAFKVTGMASGDSVKSVVSSNKRVLKVSNVKSNGTFKLSALKKGTAKLTITTAYGAKKTVKVTVQSKAVKTTKISGLSKKITVKKGKSARLKPVITPVTSQDKVTYKTSNKKVATVSGKGVVKGKKAGKAKITVKSGSKKFTVTVVVKK